MSVGQRGVCLGLTVISWKMTPGEVLQLQCLPPLPPRPRPLVRVGLTHAELSTIATQVTARSAGPHVGDTCVICLMVVRDCKLSTDGMETEGEGPSLLRHRFLLKPFFIVFLKNRLYFLEQF